MNTSFDAFDGWYDGSEDNHPVDYFTQNHDYSYSTPLGRTVGILPDVDQAPTQHSQASNQFDYPFYASSAGRAQLPMALASQEPSFAMQGTFAESMAYQYATSPLSPLSASQWSSDGDTIDMENEYHWNDAHQQAAHALQYSDYGIQRSSFENDGVDVAMHTIVETQSSTSSRPPPVSRTNPPMLHSTEDGVPRRQMPRSPHDAYTSRWIRGDGSERAGWCGICSSWHKLKDSAYWYHMHFTHGVSFTTGKEFEKPRASRQASGSIGCEVLCGGCNQWLYIGRMDRWQTPYYRHAYKCQVKNKIGLERTRSRTKSNSPKRPTAGQSRKN